MKKEEREFKNKEIDLRDKLLKGLPPIQQAKMVLFQAHFKRKMKQIMGHARRMEHRKRIMEEREDHLKKINEKKKFRDEMHLPPSLDEGDMLP